MADYAIDNKPKSIYYPTPLKVSTMTAVTKINGDINLKNLYDLLELNSNIEYIELGKENKGFALKNKKKKRKKIESKTFYNQLTLIINSPTYKKKINMKIFNNGNIQFTGLRDRFCAEELMDYIINNINEKFSSLNEEEIEEIIQYKKLDENEIKKDIFYEGLRIVLINSDFSLGFPINRDNLYKIIIDNNIWCSYEPCIYPGINIKFYYNINNKKNDGICHCKEKCLGKGKGLGDGDCKRITICMFQSGKALITGGQNNNQIMMAFLWMKQLIFNNMAEVRI